MDNGIQESNRRNFLLGELPDEEVGRLEVQFLTDDEQFEQMLETESRLVDGYVRNKLSSHEREKFEHHYLSSPIHVERVAFARHLMDRVDQSRADPITPPVDNRPGVLERFRLWPLSWQLAAAAVILLAAAVTFWLIREQSRLRSELTQVRSEREAQRDQEKAANDRITAIRDENNKLTSELERARAAKVAEPRPSETEPEKPPKVLAFALSPVLVRSNSDQQVLTLPADIESVVRLQLRAEPSETRRFSVTIRTVEGEEIWKQRSTTVRLDGTGNASIIASVPSRKLPVGDYILTLTAINSPASQEEINRYFFRVLRK